MSKLLQQCPRCGSVVVTKSGVVGGRQRYKCKTCSYMFTVGKLGKQIDQYYVVKALQLYLEGLSYREIERILGISHVTVINWVRRYQITRPLDKSHHPTYVVLNHAELTEYLRDKRHLSGHGLLITEVGDKYMLIKWERFRE